MVARVEATGGQKPAMNEHLGRWTQALNVLLRLAILAVIGLWPAFAMAEDEAQLHVTAEAGYGRLVLSFPGRNDLPEYSVKYENGVLAIEFTEPIKLLLPDVSVALPEYISVARVDPDSRGVRFGLRTALNINHMEAAEKLFVDLMPTSWQGLPPALPEEVIADLANRAKEAERLAEQKRKAEDAKRLQPVATLRVGRNPTFLRVEFTWNVDTKAKFAVNGEAATIDFEWPVPIDLYAIKADMPEELKSVLNAVTADGSAVTFRVAPGVTPRFYTSSPQNYVLDIDISRERGLEEAIAAAEKLKAEQEAKLHAEEAAHGDELAADAEHDSAAHPQISLTPVISTVGSTVRVAFPFEQDTAAAVFRRADTVWLLFDTSTVINAPPASEALSMIADKFEVIPAGDAEVVRIDLSAERLATLGSEGRSWVLSLGDVLLNPTEPLSLNRVRDREGRFEMHVDLERPAKVHQFRDPDVGDLLTVVTAYPPSRGASRSYSYVDFTALRSVQGLVVRPDNDELQVSIEGKDAVLRTESGLTLSDVVAGRPADAEAPSISRTSYLDLIAAASEDPESFVRQQEELISRAADGDGRLRDVARMDLAELLIANRFAHEAVGVLDVLAQDLKFEEFRKKVDLLKAVAAVGAYRPDDAVEILTSGAYDDEVDGVMWRAIARTEAGDYAGGRLDAIASEGVLDSYPAWVRSRFLLAGSRAAIETRDMALATRLLGRVEFAKLDAEDISTYQLLEGRLAELDGRLTEALDAYGQVIGEDVRPTRAEAVYRTLLVLNQEDRVDLEKASATLAAEAMMWRGNRLEADMSKLLAELHFRNKKYREGFEVVRQAVAYYPENDSIAALLDEAQKQFGQLYLDGGADQLEDVDALSLFYDYQQLTPPGARGDEMIRNLARRLVKADLLSQAGDLLEYQIDNRLKGVAQSQIAADLAVIRIADRDPQAALRVLTGTRLADLSPMLERQRRVLEARALIDAGREALALDLLSRITGRDADLLRIDGFWKSKAYGRAAELIETAYAPSDAVPTLDKSARMQVIKAAVGFVLVNDRMGISRLRSKFSDALSNSAEWPVFDFVTSDISPTSDAFKKVAREVANLDSLNAFLSSYRQLYSGTDGVAPDQAAEAKPGNAA
jgi:hypothetical protein